MKLTFLKLFSVKMHEFKKDNFQQWRNIITCEANYASFVWTEQIIGLMEKFEILSRTSSSKHLFLKMSVVLQESALLVSELFAIMEMESFLVCCLNSLIFLPCLASDLIAMMYANAFCVRRPPSERFFCIVAPRQGNPDAHQLPDSPVEIKSFLYVAIDVWVKSIQEAPRLMFAA
jgi:hypothetical protein